MAKEVKPFSIRLIQKEARLLRIYRLEAKLNIVVNEIVDYLVEEKLK